MLAEYTPTALGILCGTRALLAASNSWVQEAAAKDVRGVEVPPDDTSAMCWCLSGALLTVASRMVGPISLEHIDIAASYIVQELRARQELPLGSYSDIASIPSWNDAAGRAHGEVLDVLDAAIALAARDADSEGCA